MSKLNIIGIIKSIKSKSNVYTPIIEAIVNSIDSIRESNRPDGKIIIIVKRENTLPLDNSIPAIKSLEIIDNGIGFNQKNRDSFDTFYSDNKISRGGKGFGRFMFLKYFNNVQVRSTYFDDQTFYTRCFNFGKQFDIVTNETNNISTDTDSCTHIYLNNIIDDKHLDKGLDTIARKLLERLLIFFINDKEVCPTIIISEEDDSQSIILNNYLSQDNDIKLIDTIDYEIETEFTKIKECFTAKIFKIFYAQSQKSKICLTGHNREVTEVALHNYIPEFEDDFFDEIDNGNEIVRKNYIIKAYVLGEYLNDNVSLEREAFNFSKDKRDQMYELSQLDIEQGAANIIRMTFSNDVKIREDKKAKIIVDYVNSSAPWHKIYVESLNLEKIPYHVTPKQIEMEFQKIKFEKEQEARIELASIIDSEDGSFDSDFSQLITKVTEAGKNDLTHYVCNRRIVLKMLRELLKRREDGKAELEKELHNLIFPMVKDDTQISYDEHNLWLLDERLVFSDYIASDRKISSKLAPTEPDLVIFDKKRSFRNGDNEFSNPLTIFEFKRPKRTNYSADEDPVDQVGNYADEIRAGKYEIPDGLEKIKVNDNTPIYGYIICDPCEKIRQIVRKHQLTISPDGEGYYGFHNGYNIYFEILESVI